MRKNGLEMKANSNFLFLKYAWLEKTWFTYQLYLCSICRIGINCREGRRTAIFLHLSLEFICTSLWTKLMILSITIVCMYETNTLVNGFAERDLCYFMDLINKNNKEQGRNIERLEQYLYGHSSAMKTKRK